MRSLPTSDIFPKVVNLDFNELPIERALGIIWDTKSDLLKVKAVSKTFPCTKRGLLSCVSSIFDPLAIVNSLVLEAKLIIQELCEKKHRMGYKDTKRFKTKMEQLEELT